MFWDVPPVIFMAKIVFGAVGVAVLLAIVLLPGMLFVNLVSHEFYHIMRHSGAADSLCFDIDNFLSVAYVNVKFDNESVMKSYAGSDEDAEERMANLVGKVSSAGYVLFSLLSIFLIGWVVAEGVRCRFVGKLRYLRGRLKARFRRKAVRKRK